MEQPFALPLPSLLVYGLGIVPLIIVVVVLLVSLLYTVGLRSTRISRFAHPYDPQQGLNETADVSQLLHQASTMLATIEQRLTALERQGDREHETLILMLDRLATRTRTPQRKSPRED